MCPVIERNARVRMVHDDGNMGPLWFKQLRKQHLEELVPLDVIAVASHDRGDLLRATTEGDGEPDGRNGTVESEKLSFQESGWHGLV